MLFDLPPSLVAALTGFLSGFLLSVPVGPVNLTIMNEGARRGCVWALLIGFGAVTMEVIYCALAFTGFASLFTGRVSRGRWNWAALFSCFTWDSVFVVRSVAMPTGVEEQIKGRLNPHAAFAIGFVRVMANPGVFVFWIVLAANFICGDWVCRPGRGSSPAWPGVAGGTSVWFSGLSYAVSRGHGKFTEKPCCGWNIFRDFVCWPWP